MREWCLSGRISLCTFNVTVSFTFSTLALIYSLFQRFGSSYKTTTGVQRSVRNLAPFMSFAFYGYGLLQFSHDDFLLYSGYLLVVLCSSLGVHILGIYCFWHISAVHQMYRVSLSPFVKYFFFGTGIIGIILGELGAFLSIFFLIQFPVIIPSFWGSIKLFIDLIITWNSYTKIVLFAKEIPLDVKEKAERKHPNRFIKLRQTLCYSTMVVLVGEIALIMGAIQAMKNPWVPMPRVATWVTVAGMITLMFGLSVVLYIGGPPMRTKKSKDSINSSAPSTTRQLSSQDKPRTLSAPSDERVASASTSSSGPICVSLPSPLLPTIVSQTPDVLSPTLSLSDSVSSVVPATLSSSNHMATEISMTQPEEREMFVA